MMSAADSDKHTSFLVLKPADDSAETTVSRKTVTVRWKFVVCAGVLVLAVLCLFVAATVFTTKILSDHSSQVIQRSFEFKTDTDQRVHQELTAYLADREVVQRTSVDGQHDTWIVDDFNRDIRVLVQPTICYASPVIDRTNSMQFQQLINFTLPAGTVARSVREGHRVVFGSAISDKSVLGVQARRLCQHVPLHWTIDTPESVAEGRLKRAADCTVRVCFQVCCPMRFRCEIRC
jgi:hypothetical protein